MILNWERLSLKLTVKVGVSVEVIKRMKRKIE